MCLFPPKASRRLIIITWHGFYDDKKTGALFRAHGLLMLYIYFSPAENEANFD